MLLLQCRMGSCTYGEISTPQQSVAWQIRLSEHDNQLTGLPMWAGVCVHILPGVGVGPSGVAGAQ